MYLCSNMPPTGGSGGADYSFHPSEVAAHARFSDVGEKLQFSQIEVRKLC